MYPKLIRIPKFDNPESIFNIIQDSKNFKSSFSLEDRHQNDNSSNHVNDYNRDINGVNQAHSNEFGESQVFTNDNNGDSNELKSSFNIELHRNRQRMITRWM